MKVRSAFQPSPATKAYFLLNGNSTDYSGNGKSLTVNGTVNDIIGKFGFGKQATWNATNNLSNSAILPSNLGTGDITFSCWIKKSAAPTNNYTGIIMVIGTTANGKVYLNASQTNGYAGFRTEDAGGATEIVSTKNICNNAWHHVLGTKNGAVVSVYVDGIQVGTFSGTSRNIANNTYAIGTGGNATEDNLGDAIIDEVIIESRAWTAAEVSTYYRKSMLNYGVKKSWFNFPGISYILSAATGTYNLAGQSNILNRVINLICSAGSYALTGFTISFTRLHGYIIEARTGFYNLIGGVISLAGSGSWKWNKQTKNNSTFTNKTKNSSSWNEQIKN